MTHSKRKLTFVPKRLLDNISSTENKTNYSVTNDDVIKNGSLNVTTSSINDVTNRSNNEVIKETNLSFNTSLQSSSKNKSKYRDTSGRSTCVLQRTPSDSGVRLSSFACDSKSCISDFLQASW